MTELFTILKDIILPIFIIMGIGFFMQKKFTLNLQTLAKLNIYFLVPGFIFVKLYETHISGQILSTVVFFFVALVLVLYLVASIISKILGLNKGKKTTFSNSVMFFNSDNYGVPVNDFLDVTDSWSYCAIICIRKVEGEIILPLFVLSVNSRLCTPYNVTLYIINFVTTFIISIYTSHLVLSMNTKE